MTDYKTMYFHITNQSGIAVEVMESSTQILSTATQAISDLLELNSKSIKDISNTNTKTIIDIIETKEIKDIVTANNQKINDIIDSNYKSVSRICDILTVTSTSLEKIKEKIKAAHQRTEQMFMIEKDSDN